MRALLLTGGQQAVMVAARDAASLGSAELIGGLGRNGKIIMVTGVSEPMQFSPSLLLGGSRSIGGWVGGAIEEAIQFSILFMVMPMVEVFPLEQAALACQLPATYRGGGL